MKPWLRNSLVLTSLILGAAILLSLAGTCQAKPTDAELARATAKVVRVGWGWLHAEGIKVTELRPEGRDYRAHLSYTIVVDRDPAELSDQERERFRTFLPRCAREPLAKGLRCVYDEETLFTATNYGWLPRDVVEYRPDLMPLVGAGSPAPE